MSSEGEKVDQSKSNSVQEFSTDLLRVYYGRLFPYDALFNWLAYGNDPQAGSEAVDKDFFSKREWSFTIEDDIYIRYQSFKDKDELIAAIQKRQPHKIDIGAVFTGCPKDHNTIKPENFYPTERELVFDIDMTDYDDIRTCCSGAAICQRCWPYMTMAIKVIDKALREDFAFKHILWIYSGRRGVHCWVCDPEARSLPNEARAAVVEYLTIHTGSTENSDKKLKQSFESPHPMVRRAYSTLEPYFASCIADEKGQGLLARKDRYMKILNTLPNDSVKKELYDRWDGKEDSLTGEQRWQHIKAATTAPLDQTPQQQAATRKRKINYGELESWRLELVFTHCYARLDANVSKTQNHLLKSAFCVHPKTGRVCVPIDPTKADDFDPFTVPTVRSLCAEVDEYDRNHMDVSAEDTKNSSTSELDKTSLKSAVEVFNKTFMQDLWATIRKGFKNKMDERNAANMDF